VFSSAFADHKYLQWSILRMGVYLSGKRAGQATPLGVDPDFAWPNLGRLVNVGGWVSLIDEAGISKLVVWGREST
jgi:hypothetical protein